MRRIMDYCTSHRAAIWLLSLVILGLILRLVVPRLAWASDIPCAVMAASICLSLGWRRRRLLDHPGMWLFHAGLALFIVALLVAPLWRVHGYFELAEGQTLQGNFIFFNAGGLAAQEPPGWWLTQGAIDAQYTHGEIGRRIDSSLVLRKDDRVLPVHFMQPVIIDGYRIEPTGNMGYAAILAYRGNNGLEQRGVVNFPGYPRQRYNQVNQFITPAGVAAKVSLIMVQAPYQELQPWSLQLPPDYHLQIHHDWQQFVLAPGQQQQLPLGSLRFEGLKRWLGYSVSRDPLAPWVFLGGALGLAGLARYGVAKKV